MRRNQMSLIAAIASLGIGSLDVQASCGGGSDRRFRPRRPKGEPHAGTRETERRQRQEARRAERSGS